MPDIPTRQKALLIVLFIVLAYLVYTILPDSSGDVSPRGSATRGTTGPVSQQQARFQQQMGSQDQWQSSISAGAQGENKFRPAFDLILKDDPFFREPKLGADTAGYQSLAGRLENLNFNGTVENKFALINDNFYEVGDDVGGLQIMEIQFDRVILRDRDGNEFILR